MQNNNITQIKSEKKFDLKEFFLQWEWLLLVLLIGILITNASLSPDFFSFRTIMNSTTSFLDKAFMVFPMTFILLLGKIDISVGSIVALSAVTMAMSFEAGVPMVLAIIICLFVGAICGSINGLLVTRYPELPAMILTLGTQTLFRGLSYIFLENKSISGFPQWFQQFSWGKVGLIPIMALVFIAFAVIYSLVLHKTAFGRELKSIGFNERTSKYSGIRVERNIILSYVLLGVMASVTAMFLASRMSSVRADIAVGYELEVIAMAVLGGVSTNGGIGKMYGPIIAVFIIGFLRYGLGLINVSSQIITLVIGVLLIVSVLVTKLRFRKKTI